SETGNFTGLVDLNDFATGKQTFDAPISGNIVLAGDGTGANSLTANVGNPSSATLTFTSYVVDPNTLFLVGIDTDKGLAGPLLRQPKTTSQNQSHCRKGSGRSASQRRVTFLAFSLNGL